MRLPEQIMPEDTPLHGTLMDMITRYDRQLYAAGIQLSLQNDFHELKETGKTLDKLPLTPNFDPDVNDVGPANAFWMKGVDVTGEVVFTQAARMYDCSNITLAILHQRLNAFYARPEQTAEKGETCICVAPATHSITGQVSYHGEIWLKPSYRKRGLTESLPRLMLALILMRWAPDYVFGMAQPGICHKGVGARYGYRHMQPHGMIWDVPSTGTLDEWIIWNDLDDMRWVLMRPSVE